MPPRTYGQKGEPLLDEETDVEHVLDGAPEAVGVDDEPKVAD